MKKFVTEDRIESTKLDRCIECADHILKRMNYARLKKEQQTLLKQIKNNLDIQIPNDDKLHNLHVRIEPVVRIISRIRICSRIVSM
jgi:hypothetical protein